MDGDYEVDYRFRHKAGEYRWLHDQFTVMRAPEGRPAALIGSVSDITARKQAEQAVRDSEMFVKGVLNSLTAHIAVTDGTSTQAVLAAAQRMLAERFELQHATLQVEVGDDERCHVLHW